MTALPAKCVRLFDTHVHFDGFAGTEPVRAVVDRAVEAGVDRMIAIGGSPDANRRAVDIARANLRHVRAAIGINRDQVETAWSEDELTVLVSALEVVAVGEIGLDFHSPSSLRQTQGYGVAPPGLPTYDGIKGDKDFAISQARDGKLRHENPVREAQIRLFERMLAVACQHGLPVIVHSRDAESETIAILEHHVRDWTGPKDQIGVQHCFTGSQRFADRLLEMGFFISFSGIITFSNVEDLRAIAVTIPDDRLLIETDSPWLAPEPFRGKPNEPAHARRVAETLAEIRHTSVEAISAATFRNAERLFGIGSIAHGTHGTKIICRDR